MQYKKTLDDRFATLVKRATVILERKVPTDGDETDGSAPYRIDSAEAIGWSTSALNLLSLSFGKDHLIVSRFEKQSARVYYCASEFSKAKSIFEAAHDDFQHGLVGDLKSLVNADACSDLIGQAKELLEKSYVAPAGIVAGVALELRLKSLCENRQIAIGKVDKMNADLKKVDAYNSTTSKKITAWADIRNKGAHGQWNDINARDVSEMIEGIENFIGSVT